MIARGRGRGRRPATGTEEEQAALVAASNNVVLSDSDLSFSSDEASGDGEEAGESKSSSSRGGERRQDRDWCKEAKGSRARQDSDAAALHLQLLPLFRPILGGRLRKNERHRAVGEV